MRSVSLQISWVNSALSALTSLSSNCAAPLMPDSGFFISCASIADIALTERAAPRWVNCLSMRCASDRGWTSTAPRPRRPIFKWRNMQVNNTVWPSVRCTQINAIFIETQPVRQTIFNQIDHRAAKRHEGLKRMLAQAGKACTEKFLRGEIGIGNLMLEPDRQYGLGHAVQNKTFANAALMRLFRFHGHAGTFPAWRR